MNQPPHTLTIPLQVPSAIRLLAKQPAEQVNLCVASVGVTYTNASSLGGSLVWVDGVAAQSGRREAFLSHIRAGEVPTLTSDLPLLESSLSVQASTSQETLNSQTLAEALGASSALIDVFARASKRRCPVCSAISDIFHSPDEMVAAILRSCDGKPVELFLHGDEAPLQSWVAIKGFQVEAHPADGVLIESLIVSASSASRLFPLLHSIWRLPGVWLSVRSGDQTNHLSPSGFCGVCRRILLAASRASVARYLNGADATADIGGLVTHDLSLDDCMSQPIGDLVGHRAFHDSPLERCLDLAVKVGLGRYSLRAEPAALAPHAVVKATISRSLYHQREGAMVIIDTICSALSEREEKDTRELVAHAALSAPLVVVTPTRAPHPILTEHHISRDNAWANIEAPGSSSRLPIGVGTRCSLQLATDEQSGWLREVRMQLESLQSERSFTMTYVPIFPRHEMRRLTVAEELDLYERLSRMFASSHDAKVLGLTASSFRIGSHADKRSVCSLCRGLGLELHRLESLPRPTPVLCSGCRGTRFSRGIREVTFRGMRLGDLLGRSVRDNKATLKVLPKASRLVDVLESLGLDHLPLGFPVALLSPSEFRRLSVAKALAAARPERPALLMFEDPWLGHSQENQIRLARILEREPLGNTSWLMCHRGG